MLQVDAAFGLSCNPLETKGGRIVQSLRVFMQDYPAFHLVFHKQDISNPSCDTGLNLSLCAREYVHALRLVCVLSWVLCSVLSTVYFICFVCMYVFEGRRVVSENRNILSINLWVENLYIVSFNLPIHVFSSSKW